MSEQIRLYRNLSNYNDGDDLLINTVFTGQLFGKGFQFSIGSKFCMLTDVQVQDLIHVLKIELEHSKDREKYAVVDSDGGLLEVEPD